jgi:hypothetical protein
MFTFNVSVLLRRTCLFTTCSPSVYVPREERLL